jgi:hypothetical protein
MDFNTIPAGAPPPGITPNVENPETRFSTVAIASIVIQFVTFAFILLRAYINIGMRRICPEDIFLYIAWCAFVASTSLTVYAGTKGITGHVWDMSLATVLDGSYQYNNAVICYAISGGFAKAAVFLQLKKIFTTPLRGNVYWVIVISMVVNAIAYTILLFLYVFNCWPLARLRNPLLPGHCVDWKKSVIAIGSINLISDVEALCVPAWAIWRLKLDVKKKFEVFAVFAVGALAVGIACLGLYYRVLAAQRYDYTWHLAQCAIVKYAQELLYLSLKARQLINLCSVAELGSVIIVGCCPAIPRLFRRNRGRREPPSRSYSYSGSRSRGKPKKEVLDDSHSRDSAAQGSNSVVTLEMYGYANSIVDHRLSEEISSCGEDNVHAVSRPITSIDMIA